MALIDEVTGVTNDISVLCWPCDRCDWSLFDERERWLHEFCSEAGPVTASSRVNLATVWPRQCPSSDGPNRNPSEQTVMVVIVTISRRPASRRPRRLIMMTYSGVADNQWRKRIVQPQAVTMTMWRDVEERPVSSRIERPGQWREELTRTAGKCYDVGGDVWWWRAPSRLMTSILLTPNDRRGKPDDSERRVGIPPHAILTRYFVMTWTVVSLMVVQS